MSNNGIEREKPDVANCEIDLRTKVTGMERMLNGDWLVSVFINGSVLLPDGRHVAFHKVAEVRGQQFGRKPRSSKTGVSADA